MVKRVVCALMAACFAVTAAGCIVKSNDQRQAAESADKEYRGVTESTTAASSGASETSGTADTTETTETSAASETNNYDESVSAPLKVGDKVPDFKAELVSGDSFILSEHKDDVVFVNIWATWCPYCVREFPELQQIVDEYKDKKFAFIAIDQGEDKETVDSYIQKEGYTFNVAYDPDMILCYNKFPTSGIPYSVIIKDGKVVKIFSGAPRDAYGTYKAAIDEALG